MNNIKRDYYSVVTILGILICIIWIMTVNTKPDSDFYYYNELAKQIANGGSWGETYTSVGYSIILGFVYWIFGYNLIYAKIFNLMLTLINYILVYVILKKMDFNETKRKIIYTLFVFFPNNIFYTSLVANEVLFTTIFLLITLIYHSTIKYKYILLGLLVGINAMIKPFFIIFFLVVFIVELGLKKRIKKALINTFFVLVSSFICISPWIYRNTKLIGQPTFISNNGGIVLYINNNSQNKYGKWMPSEKVENSVVQKKEYLQANATEKNHILTSSAKNWIKNHPVQFIQLGFKRLFYVYFNPNDIFYTFYGAGLNTYFEVLAILYAFLVRLIIFIPSIIYIIKYSMQIVVCLLSNKVISKFNFYNLVCFYMFSCVYFITEGQGRYAFPFIFVVLCFFSFIVEKHFTKS